MARSREEAVRNAVDALVEACRWIDGQYTTEMLVSVGLERRPRGGDRAVVYDAIKLVDRLERAV